MPPADAVAAFIAAPMADASPIAARSWWCGRRSCTGRPPSWWCLAPASVPMACAGMPDAAVTEPTHHASRQKPRSRGVFCWGCRQRQPRRRGNGRTEIPPSRELIDRALPVVTAAPVAAAAAPPAAAMPAPVAATAPAPAAAAPAPTPPAPSPVAASAAPAHLFGRQTIDLVAGGDRRLRIAVSRRQRPR